MEYNDIHLATARIHFSEIDYFFHRACYVFDITFDETSTILFDHLAFIPAGADEDVAEEFLKAVKQYFATAGIYEGTEVAVLFAGSKVLAISARGNDLWIDVHEGVFPHVPPKYFGNLGITIASLTVH